MYAVRDDEAALDIVQDAMLKLTENSAGKIRLERSDRSRRGARARSDCRPDRASAGEATGASTRGVLVALLGGTRCGGNCRRDGLLRRKRQDPLLARGPRAGRSAVG